MISCLSTICCTLRYHRPIAGGNCVICHRSKRICCLYFAPLRQVRSLGHPLSRICTLVMSSRLVDEREGRGYERTRNGKTCALTQRETWFVWPEEVRIYGLSIQVSTFPKMVRCTCLMSAYLIRSYRPGGLSGNFPAFGGSTYSFPSAIGIRAC
jgi:hypothetical protein